MLQTEKGLQISVCVCWYFKPSNVTK